jgi:hypothetical protein
MGVVTRTAKPDLDPETRRWFGRPPFRKEKAGTGGIRAAESRAPVCVIVQAEQGRTHIHQSGLVDRPAGAKSAKEVGLVFSYPSDKRIGRPGVRPVFKR